MTREELDAKVKSLHNVGGLYEIVALIVEHDNAPHVEQHQLDCIVVEAPVPQVPGPYFMETPGGFEPPPVYRADLAVESHALHRVSSGQLPHQCVCLHYVGQIAYHGLMGRPPDGASARETPITTRFSQSEASQLDRQRELRGFGDRSAYLRYLVRSDGVRIRREKGQ